MRARRHEVPGRGVGGGRGRAAYRIEWETGVCEATFCHGLAERRTYGSIVSDGSAAATVEARGGSRTLFLGFGTELTTPFGALQLVGGKGSVAVTVDAGLASVWFEADAGELRLCSPGVERVRLVGRDVPFARDGEDVVVRLGTAGRE